jgi:transcriptional regulator with XRE-family HTH domain
VVVIKVNILAFILHNEARKVIKRPMFFGKRLRRERQKRHLSQEALAEIVGISSKSISRWEQGQALPRGYVRLLLCRFFHLHPDDLFAEHDEQTEPLFYHQTPQTQHEHSEHDSTDVAQVLHTLAELYAKQGKYEQAEPLFHQALQIWEERDHSSTYGSGM